jgi:serine/threonine protein phosphatase PrpC
VRSRSPRVACTHHEQGKRPTQEDRHIDIQDPSGWTLFAILDGHGGVAVVNHAASAKPHGLGPTVLAALKRQGSEDTVAVRKLLQAVFVDYDRSLAAMPAAQECGTTVTMVVIPPSRSKMWFVNVGDSETALFRSDRAFSLVSRTVPHKPDPPASARDPKQRQQYTEERRRIKAAGGIITRPEGDTWRVAVDGSPFAMSLSRGLGDLALKVRHGSRGEQVVDHVGGVMSAMPTIHVVALPPPGKSEGTGARFTGVLACHEYPGRGGDFETGGGSAGGARVRKGGR